MLAMTNMVYAESIVTTTTTVDFSIEPVMVEGYANEEILPARLVGESLWYDVVWNEENRSIDFILGNDTFTATVGSNEYYVNEFKILDEQ